MNLENQMMMTDALSATLNGSDPDGDIDKMYIPAVFAEHFVKIVAREFITTKFKLPQIVVYL